MKIEQFHSNYVQNTFKNSDERKNGYVEGKTVGKSSVEISTEAKALVKRIRESEESHFSEKVEHIRRSIQEGSYAVDTDKIADKIMEKLDQEKAGFHE